MRFQRMWEGAGERSVCWWGWGGVGDHLRSSRNKAHSLVLGFPTVGVYFITTLRCLRIQGKSVKQFSKITAKFRHFLFLFFWVFFVVVVVLFFFFWGGGGGVGGGGWGSEFYSLTTIRSNRLLYQSRELYLNNFRWLMFTNGRRIITSCQICPAKVTCGAGLLEFSPL